MTFSGTQKLLILLTFSCLFFFSSKAQNATNAKLVGCWKVMKVEFPEPDEDSVEIKANFKGASTCFEADGKFASKQFVKGKEINVGTGTYRIGKDGKTLFQKSNQAEDDSIDAVAQILELTDDTFSIKVEQIILNFKKLQD